MIRDCVCVVFFSMLNTLVHVFVSTEMDLTSSSSLLICVVLAAALIGGTRSEGVCLQDGKHKATPSPEPHLTECSLYADSE